MKKPVVESPAARTRAPRKAASKPPRKTAANASSRSAEKTAGDESAARPPKNILTAGIKALTHAHEEAVARQSRVFESLLGLGPKRTADAANDSSSAATTPDPFGFRKFEDVFDQRVARALQNLQVPTAQAFAELTAEVERLRQAVAVLESQARKR